VSRLATMSPAAVKALFSQESDATLITLLTITGAGITEPIRLADGYTQRVSETDDEVVYGVPSRGNDFLFLPLQINLPSEDDAAPRSTITIHDVTRHLTPIIRTISTCPDVLIELVLSTTPNVVEASFPGFTMSGITYNANTIAAELNVDGLALEPFPAYCFTPAYFPGLF
jgi:hypothetical protein